MLKKPLNKIRYPFLRASFTENPLPFKKLNRKGLKLKNLSNKKGLSYRIGKVQKNIIEQETTTKIESTLTKQNLHTVEGVSNVNKIYNFYSRKSTINTPFLKTSLKEPIFQRDIKDIRDIKCVRNRFYKSKYIFSLGQLKAEFSRKQVQNNKYSHFKTLLEERKKCMIAYGCLNKKQMQSLFLQAKALHGKIDENFIKIAESRLDLTLFRIGFFPTISSARQWINHGHILVNNSVINLPGYQLKGGDIITVAPDKRVLLKRKISFFIAQKIKIRAFHYSVKVKAFYAILKSCIVCQPYDMEQTKKKRIRFYFKKTFLKIKKLYSYKRLPLFSLLPLVFLFFSRKGTKKQGQLLPFLKMRNLFTVPRPLRQRVGSFKISGMKPLNLEVCYKKMVAIFLYSPQKVALPASIDLHSIAKSI